MVRWRRRSHASKVSARPSAISSRSKAASGRRCAIPRGTSSASCAGRTTAGRPMSSKQTTMRDAVADLVRDGDTVAIEGFTHLICFAAGHEIIRQRKRDLTLARMTPDVIYDQMVAGGEIGRASCRERVEVWVDGGECKRK